MTDSFNITIQFVNDVYCKVVCNEESVSRELDEYLTFVVPNARFHPSFRAKLWNGKIHLYNMYSELLYVGLIPYVQKFCLSRNYSISIDPKISERYISDVSLDEIKSFITSLNIHSKNNPITPYDYQICGIHHALTNSRCLLLSPTASGKSLIIYGMVRYLESVPGKTLIVVPTISLVSQLHNDFVDYSSANKWNADDKCHKIYEGQDKNTDKNIIISTWQSIYKLPKKYFEQFTKVVVDECFDGKTKVKTPTGYTNIEDIKPGDLVLNIDSTNKVKVDKVINIHRNLIKSASEKMYKLEFDDGTSIEVTGNHQLLTKNRGWVRADELTEEDEMLCPE